MKPTKVNETENEAEYTGMKTRRRFKKDALISKHVSSRISEKKPKFRVKRKSKKESRKRNKDQLAILERFYE